MVTVGYIRRSHDGEAPISQDVQTQAIKRLAEARELTVDHWYRDWGKSGLVPDGVGDTLPEILAHRPQALEMMRDVEAGNVGAILAYRQDRLARDSFTVQLMIRIAKRAGVPVVIPRGDITAREQRLLTAVEGGMDEEEGTRSKERSDAAERTMDQRGDERGPAPYGWTRMTPGRDGTDRIVKVLTDPDKPARVIRLFREIGSYNGTARKLNDDGVPPPFVPKNGQRRGSAGPPMWSAATVRDIVQREAPDLAKQVSANPRAKRAFLLRGLLRCHCGAPMTASGNPRGNEYYCNRGKRGAHRPYGISERKVRPWVEAEAERLRVPHEDIDIDAPGAGYDDSRERANLEAMRSAIGDDAYTLAIANLDAKRTEHGDRERIAAAVPPRVDWEGWSTEAINTALRAVFAFVQLGDDLRPVRAEWNVPEWRTE